MKLPVSRPWKAAFIVAGIYIGWVLFMFRNPGRDAFFREVLLTSLTAPASFLLRSQSTQSHFIVPTYVLPFANVLLMFSPFLILAAIRAGIRRYKAR